MTDPESVAALADRGQAAGIPLDAVALRRLIDAYDAARIPGLNLEAIAVEAHRRVRSDLRSRPGTTDGKATK